MTGADEMVDLYSEVWSDPKNDGPGDAEGIISPVESHQRNDSGVGLRVSLEITVEDGVSHVGELDEPELDHQSGGYM